MENNVKTKQCFKIAVLVLLCVITAASVTLSVLAGIGISRKGCCRDRITIVPLPVKHEKTVFTFDTDGGDKLYPMEFENTDYLSFDYFYSAYKPDSVFMGWQYNGKYIEEYGIETFKKPGTFNFKAIWQKVDSLQQYNIQRAVYGAGGSVSDYWTDFNRNGYRISFIITDPKFDTFYEAGITAIETIKAMKANYPEYDALIREYSIGFIANERYTFSTEFDNSAHAGIDKLTNFTSTSGGAVSLLTLEEYNAIKTQFAT